MGPLTPPHKRSGSTKGAESRVDSQLKRFFSEREQFIDTIRHWEKEYKEMKQAIESNFGKETVLLQIGKFKITWK